MEGAFLVDDYCWKKYYFISFGLVFALVKQLTEKQYK